MKKTVKYNYKMICNDMRESAKRNGYEICFNFNSDKRLLVNCIKSINHYDRINSFDTDDDYTVTLPLLIDCYDNRAGLKIYDRNNKMIDTNIRRFEASFNINVHYGEVRGVYLDAVYEEKC